MIFKITLWALVCAMVMSFTFDSKVNFRPPGTVKIVDNFFIDEGEVSNINWKEYLSYLEVTEGLESEAYKNAFPDMGVWKKEGYDLMPFEAEYFSNPAYDNYPVVGISYEQAVRFCIWRTKLVKIMLEKNDFKAPRNFEYRLPTKTEWELVSNAGYGEKSKKIIRKKYKHLIEKRGLYRKMLANMKYEENESVDGKLESFQEGSPGFSYPGPTHVYLPNKYGVFNIYGNVAEMVEEQGVAMGGSFNDYYEDIVPSNKIITYDGPCNWLGFRCVCDVIQN